MRSFEVEVEVEVEDNDLSLILVKYEELYLRELTYYGTSDHNQMLMLINIGQEISRVENIIIEKYYSKYVSEVNKSLKNLEIYYLQQILFCSLDIILTMVMLWTVNKHKLNSEEFEFKTRYLIGLLENFVEKFIDPISLNLNLIISSNKIFKINYPIGFLKKYINLNKYKFTSKEKIIQLERCIRLLS